ncbi:hypothetical protein [Planomonospora sp. ID82291]|uniref:hypothetical protein n=1 Tax=Planomonospora sp. ID82291 TaxID=2738136 RepID=UPI0018C3AF8D|nr:hypothetical protein [Planomonospora sp. ID82291]MBG0818454.1 hypothetical protein [Planomonospora sp. ID82291]
MKPTLLPRLAAAVVLAVSLLVACTSNPDSACAAALPPPAPKPVGNSTGGQNKTTVQSNPQPPRPQATNRPAQGRPTAPAPVRPTTTVYAPPRPVIRDDGYRQYPGHPGWYPAGVVPYGYFNTYGHLDSDGCTVTAVEGPPAAAASPSGQE